MNEIATTPTFREKLPRLFPPDHPDTGWFIRLAILRDDLAYELDCIALRPDAGLDEIWRCSYALRKVAITLGEAKDIFSYEVAKTLAARNDLPQQFVEAFKKDIELVKAANEVLRPIRDGLGAHVRPKNALQNKLGADPVPQVVKVLGSVDVEIRLDMETGKTTSFRTLTASSFMFAWPDVTSVEEYSAKHQEFSATLLPCCNAVLHGIDMLLWMHFAEQGIVPV